MLCRPKEDEVSDSLDDSDEYLDVVDRHSMIGLAQHPACVQHLKIKTNDRGLDRILIV